MEIHTGACRKLADELQNLMPDKFKLQSHKAGADDDCFRSLILMIVKKAAKESTLATEYAIVCKEISELYEPVAGSAVKINQFVYLVTNQVQTFFNLIRGHKYIFKSHVEYMRLDEELESESDAETVKHLKNAQMYRTNLRELSIGTIKFISQLFNVGFLKSRVIELCMKSLLGKGKNSTEHDVECFCVLLTNIGENLETAPKGAEIIEENLEIMEQIVDSQGDTFVLKTRCLILDVFELRANHWTPVGPEQVSPPKIQAKEVTEMFERKRETREFLKEVNDVVGKLKREKMLDFINCFVGAQFSKDRLDGLVHIIFEKAISSPETSMFAIVCNGLGYICAEKITEQGDHMMPTFRDFLLRLIRHEVDVVRHKASDFRTILMRLEILKQEEVKTAVEQLKELIENDIRLASRAAAVATFIGELYNAKFFESRFIFDEVFIVLVDPQFISNTTIECFVKLVKTCGIKMITEKNRSVLMKETLMRLLAAAEKITITEKSKFLIKDVLNFSRFQLKLEVSNNFEETVLNSPQLNFHWSSKLLDWNSKSPARSGSKRSKKVYNINDSDDKKFAARQFVPTAVPSMDHFTRISPSNVSSSSYAVHSSVLDYINHVPKRLYMNSSSPKVDSQYDANNNLNSSPIPIDFSQKFINPTMLGHENFY